MTPANCICAYQLWKKIQIQIPKWSPEPYWCLGSNMALIAAFYTTFAEVLQVIFVVFKGFTVHLHIVRHFHEFSLCSMMWSIRDVEPYSPGSRLRFGSKGFFFFISGFKSLRNKTVKDWLTDYIAYGHFNLGKDFLQQRDWEGRPKRTVTVILEAFITIVTRQLFSKIQWSLWFSLSETEIVLHHFLLLFCRNLWFSTSVDIYVFII